MEMTRRIMTNVAAPEGNRGPMGQFIRACESMDNVECLVIRIVGGSSRCQFGSSLWRSSGGGAAMSKRPTNMPSPTSRKRRELVRHRKCGVFARLESYLLSEHHVSRHQRSERHNTPTGQRDTVLPQLLNVASGAKMNAVLFPAGAADHVKIAKRIELGALLGRQPGSEKPQPSHCWIVRLTSPPIQPAERLSTTGSHCCAPEHCSPANQPWEEQDLFRDRIERLYPARLAPSCSLSGDKAGPS
jgi:hypothetical protein